MDDAKFLAFNSMDRTLKCEHSMETSYCSVLYCDAVCYSMCPVCNFGKFIPFGLGIVRSERVRKGILLADVEGILLADVGSL